MAIDVARALGLYVGVSGVYSHLKKLAADQKMVLRSSMPQIREARELFIGTENQLTLIAESGLYLLIVRADKATAKPFQDLVIREVPPSIRKTGG